MQHKCTYFHVVDGVRVCVQCSMPAQNRPEIEDKMVVQHEDKAQQIWPPESERITKVIKKTRR